MIKKQWIYFLLIAFFVGALGSIILGRLVLPYLATFRNLSFLNKLSSSSPIVVNRTQEVQLNEGVNLIDLVKEAGNFTVSVYDSKNNFLGNGLVMTSDGLIFTSSAVIQKQIQFLVVTNDGQKFPATIKNKDSKSGLIVLSISSANLRTGQFDNASSLQPGHRVIYMGRGNVKFEHEVLAGFITQSLANQLADKQISSDAVITSDYFGGPIVNLSGHVVGLVIDNKKNIISEDLQTFLNDYLKK